MMWIIHPTSRQAVCTSTNQALNGAFAVRFAEATGVPATSGEHRVAR